MSEYITNNELTQEEDDLNIKPINENNEKNYGHWTMLSSVCILKIILSSIAGYLVWDCNSNSHIIIKVLLTLIAILFSEIYIIYYAIYRIFMGNKCPK